MSNLLASLRTSSSALEALQEAVAVSQNNVTNASTPGYARQRLHMKALDFAPKYGLLGGVSTSELQSARNEFSEQAVRTQASRMGEARQSVSSLTEVENAFVLNDANGIPASLNKLFTSFSAWGLTPNSAAARENVISAAEDLALSFQQTARTLETAAGDAERELKSAVEQINHIAGLVKSYNHDRRTGVAVDAGAEAQLYQNLEELAEIANVQALQQDDGSITLMLGGQVPLVVGDSQYEISLDLGYRSSVPPVYPGAQPRAYILDHEGNDVSAHVHSGKLGALMEFKNKTLPGLIGDAEQQGQLNRLAQKVADRVNQILSSGYPAPANPLFVYGSSPVAIAHTLSVNPTMLPMMLQAVEPGPPPQANGKPLALAALGNPVDAADKLDGLSFVGFVGEIGADVGRQLADAKAQQDSGAQLLAQARSLRSELSGVSLDEEAVRLVEFQRAYQASARMVGILDELTEIAVNIGR